MSPDRLAGDKTWRLGEERDIWEQDGERDGGHIPAGSPSPGSVETFIARRWVPFTACVVFSNAAPVDQVSHLSLCSRRGTYEFSSCFLTDSSVYFL